MSLPSTDTVLSADGTLLWLPDHHPALTSDEDERDVCVVVVARRVVPAFVFYLPGDAHDPSFVPGRDAVHTRARMAGMPPLPDGAVVLTSEIACAVEGVVASCSGAAIQKYGLSSAPVPRRKRVRRTPLNASSSSLVPAEEDDLDAVAHSGASAEEALPMPVDAGEAQVLPEAVEAAEQEVVEAESTEVVQLVVKGVGTVKQEKLKGFIDACVAILGMQSYFDFSDDAHVTFTDPTTGASRQLPYSVELLRQIKDSFSIDVTAELRDRPDCLFKPVLTLPSEFFETPETAS